MWRVGAVDPLEPEAEVVAMADLYRSEVRVSVRREERDVEEERERERKRGENMRFWWDWEDNGNEEKKSERDVAPRCESAIWTSNFALG